MATDTNHPNPVPEVIGLIAGEGDFPVLLAKGASAAGARLVVFGIHGLASDHLKQYSETVYSLKLTELSRLIDLCEKHGARHLVMAGRVPHKVLLRQVSLDPYVLKLLGRVKDKKADSLLKAATEEIESKGIEVMDSTIFLKSCMPKKSILTPQVPPTEDILREIEFGYPIAKEIAGLDIGQTVAVKNQIVVAVEGIEGTNKLIRRAADLAGPGLVILKVSKPRQDMRFDVPVVGYTTVEYLAEAKAAALCITSGESLFFDEEKSVRLAEKHRISLVTHRDSRWDKPVD